jgi:hypothetical protein
VAKKKPAPKKPAKKKPASKATRPVEVVDASPELAAQGFFRGEYQWELDRDVPALDARVRLLVEHRDGRVTPEQVRAVESLLESKQSLRALALKAAYESMLRWVEGYRQRHPGFRGKPIAEKPFMRGCELKSVRFPTPSPAETKLAPVFVLTLFWPDDNRPCEARFEKQKSGWVVTECERN